MTYAEVKDNSLRCTLKYVIERIVSMSDSNSCFWFKKISDHIKYG